MVTKLAFFCTLAGAANILSGQYVLVASQNTLHLSGKVSQHEKWETIKEQNDKYNVNMLQEVMKTADLDDVRPEDYDWVESDLKGKSSYKETYGFVYSDYLTAVSGVEDYPDNNNEFARPPSGVLIKLEDGEYAWFIDFHAIWGKSIRGRRDEATAMADVYEYFKNLTVNKISTDKIVIAGDWNLGADDSGFDALKELQDVDLEVIPNIETSLTKTGQPSEPYDHFVGTEDTLSECALTPIPNGETTQWWRKNVSDHRGIKCRFDYQ